jgi:arsenate reductase
MTVRVYQYPKCSTCRKALKWLTDAGVEFEASDLVAHPLSARALESLQAMSGLPVSRFFNTSGESYRAGGFKDRIKTMKPSEAFAALAKDGKLIKRPIVDVGETVLVGFDEALYAETFRAAKGVRARSSK